MSEADDPPVVLAVDDEDRVVQAFALWLDSEFAVETATSGNEALEQMHDGVDVVLLDRHMPDMPGDDVLESIRADGYDVRVAMVTAVAPDFDIVDMPFDHYVSKPVDESDLRGVVERLLDVGAYDERMNELYRVSQKIATLEAEKARSRLETHDRYRSLLDRREELHSEAETLLADLETRDAELFELVDSR
jgi:CheY-like chemotaxis protein